MVGSETRAIFVQGCARSGNTLMRELCASSFQNTTLGRVNGHELECSLEHLNEALRGPRQGDEAILVTSRNRSASVFMDPASFRENSGVCFIWMLRNPLDVLTSVHKRRPGYYVQPYRLLASYNLYERFQSEPRVLTIRYEDLVSKPDEVQGVISTAFNLEPLHKFSDSSSHFSPSDQSVKALHSIRPIDTASIDKWKTNPEHCKHLLQVLKYFPEVIALAAAWGYHISVESVALAAESFPSHAVVATTGDSGEA